MLSQVLPRLKNFCKTRGIDVQQELEYIDRKRTGMLLPAIFRRFFTNIGFEINDQQFDALCKEIAQNGNIEIAKFISTLENSADNVPQHTCDTSSIYSELRKLRGYLQANNRTLRELFRQADPSCRGYVSENAFFRELGFSNEVKKIAAAYTFDKFEGVRYSMIEKDIGSLQLTTTKAKPDLTKLAEAFEFNGIDKNQVFNHYDRYRTGRIPAEAFNAVIRNFSREPQPITKYYTDNEGFVDIRQFSQDMNVTSQTISKIPKVTTKSVKPLDIDEIVSFIERELKSRHVKMSDFFGHMAGEERIKAMHFQGILNTSGLSITNDEVSALTAKFADGQFVKLQEFLTLFNKPEPQRMPEIRVEGLRDYLTFSQRRLLPLLQRCDITKTGEVDVGDLSTVLTRIGYAMDRSELEGIKRAFAGNAPGSIRYEQLCMAVEPQPKPAQPSKQEEKPQTKPRNLPPRLVTLLKKANAGFERSGVVALDEFRLADSRQVGLLTIHEVADAVSCASFTDAEVMELASFYPDRRYMDIVRDLSRPEAIPEKAQNTTQPSQDMEQALAVLKGALEVRSLTVFDVLGERYVPIQRAAGLLNKFYENPLKLCECFRDRKRPELVDVLSFERALAKVQAKKKAVIRDDAGAIYRDLGEIRAKFEARHCDPRRVFNGKPPKISFDELMDALQSLNIILEGRSRYRIRENFEINGEVDWNNFLQEIQASTTLAF